ncbi:MAG: adenylate/guanylate cyclase domain-containing protein [Tateyamaria sp.]|uniref:tetratricopeptide repeat protein n=1 Tax=Tateyamaria sp. TaxID=1929288 RepID=UPI0032A12311
MERRLAAILAADVVGYSRMIREDEEGTIAALQELRSDLLSPIVKKYRGRVFKTMGDGVLIEFASVVDAVLCGRDFQIGVAERNAGQTHKRHLEVRIGINLGDVVVDGTDIQGDGVNVAARLEGLSEPGGICIAQAVYEQVRDRVTLAFVDGGNQQVKNIDRPIGIWRWSPPSNKKVAPTGAPVSPRATAPQTPNNPSIAVLPFDNMSGDPEQEYFADGMTEDLITDLSKLSGLLVIGRNSSFVYKNRAVDLRQVGKELGVHYVLEGSVRKAGNRVRVNAQLIETSDGNHIWANRQDGFLEDVFDLQDKITQDIVDALRIKLSAGETARLASTYTNNPDAHNWFMQGRIRYREPGPQANAEAQEMLTKAVADDPRFALALAVRSYLKFHAWFFKWNSKPGALSEALSEAEKAVSIDPDLAAGHAFLGWMHMWGEGMDRAMSEHEKALELDPNYADGHLWKASTLIYRGTPELAIESMDRAMRLEPHTPPIYLLNYGHLLLQMDRYDEALSYLNAAIRKAPKFPMNYIFLAVTKASQGDVAAAQAAGKQLMDLLPTATVSSLTSQLPYSQEEHSAKVSDGLLEAGLPP